MLEEHGCTLRVLEGHGYTLRVLEGHGCTLRVLEEHGGAATAAPKPQRCSHPSRALCGKQAGRRNAWKKNLKKINKSKRVLNREGPSRPRPPHA